VGGTCLGLAQGQHGLGLLADNAPWSYVLLGVVVVAVIAVAVIAVRAVREGRSVELYKWGIKIGERAPQPIIPSAPVHKPSEVGSAVFNEQLTRWRPYAVGINHEKLLAVDDVVKSVADTLFSDSGAWAVTLSGEGGRGKTAVAYEAVKKVSESSQYTRVVWAAAKSAASRASDSNTGTATVYWADVMKVIAAQLDCPLRPSEALWEADLRNHINGLSQNERILLVVDNLEGIRDVEKVLDDVRNLKLVPPHRLIATTRWRLTRNERDVRNIEIVPLSRRDSLSLVRLIAGKNPGISSASDRYLAPIFEITDGNPYLIKLIVSRYVESGLALDRVITGLTSLRTQEGREVQSYLFEQSLGELAERSDRRSAKMLIASFCMYRRGEALSFEQLREHSGIGNEASLQHLVEVACRLTLLRPSDRNRRYSIHSLLYEYTCSPANPDAAFS
jgi:hypothetical protein